jgi:hypothetical protein
MTSFNNTVQDFRDKFKGTRSNRFIITPGTPPDGIVVPARSTAPVVNDFRVYAKATSYPGSAIGMIPVSYQGRVVKYSGERQFAEWSIQVYDSSVVSGINLRKYFENWMTLGDHPEYARKQHYNIGSKSPWKIEFDDIVNVPVVILDPAPVYKKTLFLFNCWPIDISAIDLNYEAADSFAEFTLTLAYDFHKKTDSLLVIN